MYLVAEDFSLDRDTTSFGSLWTYSMVSTTELFTSAPGAFSGYAFGNNLEIATRTISKTLSPVEDLSVGFYFNISGLGYIKVGLDGGGFDVAIGVISTTQIQIIIYQDGVQGETFISERVGQWAHLELRIVGSTLVGKSIGVRLEGFPILIGYSSNPSDIDTLKFEINTFRTGSKALIDNVVATDGEDVGQLEVVKYLPNADTWRNDFVPDPIDAPSHYSLVDDTLHDSGATSLSSTTVEHREQFFFNAVEPDTNISALGLEVTLEVSGSPLELSSMRQGHPQRIEANTISDTSGSYQSSLFLSTTDPKTGEEWLPSVVNLAFGIEVGGFSGKELIIDLSNGWVDSLTEGFPVSTLGYVDIEEPYIVSVSTTGQIELRVD